MKVYYPEMNLTYEYYIGDPALLLSVAGCRFQYNCSEFVVTTSVTMANGNKLMAQIFNYDFNSQKLII